MDDLLVVVVWLLQFQVLIVFFYGKIYKILLNKY